MPVEYVYSTSPIVEETKSIACVFYLNAKSPKFPPGAKLFVHLNLQEQAKDFVLRMKSLLDYLVRWHSKSQFACMYLIV